MVKGFVRYLTGTLCALTIISQTGELGENTAAINDILSDPEIVNNIIDKHNAYGGGY